MKIGYSRVKTFPLHKQDALGTVRTFRDRFRHGIGHSQRTRKAVSADEYNVGQKNAFADLRVNIPSASYFGEKFLSAQRMPKLTELAHDVGNQAFIFSARFHISERSPSFHIYVNKTCFAARHERNFGAAPVDRKSLLFHIPVYVGRPSFVPSSVEDTVLGFGQRTEGVSEKFEPGFTEQITHGFLVIFTRKEIAPLVEEVVYADISAVLPEAMIGKDYFQRMMFFYFIEEHADEPVKLAIAISDFFQASAFVRAVSTSFCNVGPYFVLEPIRLLEVSHKDIPFLSIKEMGSEIHLMLETQNLLVEEAIELCFGPNRNIFP